MKKILAVAIFVLTIFSTMAYSAPIVELAAPRNSSTGFESFPAPTQATQTKKQTTVAKTDKTSIKSSKNKSKSKNKAKAKSKNNKNLAKTKEVKKPVAQKPTIPPFNYNNIYKMLEYGYYDGADKIIANELKLHNNNQSAIALSIISLAKQDKLDEAQEKLDKLINKYPNNSDLHYAQGLIYYQRTSSSNMLYRNNSDVLLENASNEFDRAIELDKNNAKALNAAGVVDMLTENINSAKNYFKQANIADDKYANAIDNLGTIDMLEGNNEAAEIKFKKALSLNNKSVIAIYHLAQLASKTGDTQLTLKYLNQALELAPDAPFVLDLLGKTYYTQNNEAAAIEAFKKSISAKPEFIAAYIDLAQIYQKRGDSELALVQLKTALNITPDAYDVKLKIADISYSNAKYDQAIDNYKDLVGISNFNDLALKGLANSYYAKAQNVSVNSVLRTNSEIYKALGYINKAIEANGNDLELYLAKLKLTRLTNEPEKSRLILENIVNAKGDSMIDLVVKGEAYLTLYDYKKANELFNQAIDKSRSLKDDLHLAEIFIYHKQFEPAMKVLDKVVIDNPGYPEALNDMDYIAKCKKYSINYDKSAQAFLKSRNSASAIEYFKRSLAINPNNPKPHLQLAKLYDKQKEYNEALNNYRAFIGLTPEDKKSKRIIKKVVKRIKKLEDKLL